MLPGGRAFLAKETVSTKAKGCSLLSKELVELEESDGTGETEREVMVEGM